MEKMESFIDKLKDNINRTVTSIQGIIPGNPLTREYEIGSHLSSGGPGCIWKIFSATKKSTREEVSIFLLDKKELQKYSRGVREIILEILKKGVSQLTRLRHPSILTVSHPLEESRESIAFATEPVLGSLSNLLGQNVNLPIPLPNCIKEHEFFEVEIKYGFLQLSEGIAFLHSDVKLLHRNLSPENIIVSKKGAWKLFGFEFAVNPLNPHEFPLNFPFLNVMNRTDDVPLIALPNLNYIAPEYILQAPLNESKLSLSSDMFSLGMLIYSIYNKGKTFLPEIEGLINLTSRRLRDYENGISDSRKWDSLPEHFRHHIKLLLSIDPTLRPDAHQLNKLNIFEDVHVRTLQYLDSLFQWENLEKSHFYKGLPEIMLQMPHRVKLNRIFPALSKEFINPDMVPFVLPNVLIIVKESSSDQFLSVILPELLPVLKMSEPIQISMILMEKMELLLEKCRSNPEAIRDSILPLMSRCLEVDATQVQQLSLTTVPTVAHLLDMTSLKNVIIPRIKKLCLETNQLSIRVTAILSLAKLLDHMDKWLVIDEIVSFLPKVPSKEPAVIMAIVGIYKTIISHNKLGLTKEVVANKVIPYLMPIAIENGLTVNQFNSLIGLIKELVNQVETEHRNKLEQLNSIKSSSNMAVVSYKGLSMDDGKQLKAKCLDDILENEPIKVEPKVGNLSLQEKERLSREKEVVNRLRTQDNLIPQSKEPMMATHQPKDLTSSLINSNLANLTIGGMSKSPSTISSTRQTFDGTVNYNLSGQFNSMVGPSSTMFSMKSGSLSSQANVSLNSVQNSNRINLSAFDNLTIPGFSSKSNIASKTPMNKLSDSDIKDLLN